MRWRQKTTIKLLNFRFCTYIGIIQARACIKDMEFRAAGSCRFAHMLLSAEDQRLSAKMNLLHQGARKGRGIGNCFILLRLQGLTEKWSMLVSLLTKTAPAKRSPQRIRFQLFLIKIALFAPFYYSWFFREYNFYDVNPVFFQNTVKYFRPLANENRTFRNKLGKIGPEKVTTNASIEILPSARV